MHFVTEDGVLKLLQYIGLVERTRTFADAAENGGQTE